ncbi:hypothetical protein HAX54_030399 [Datura stramonium]|uniref:Uncharacterized protein n=1 Tax=Datura stramonium TaxID=4076 RepID=A0ABS8VAQ1_DATST|nr:hypothetical protein [Datura stramonium]
MGFFHQNWLGYGHAKEESQAQVKIVAGVVEFMEVVGLFAPAIHRCFVGWHWLFTGASQGGTGYSPVLRRFAPAIQRCFAGGTGYSSVLHRLAPAIHRSAPTIHRWFVGWHRLFAV